VVDQFPERYGITSIKQIFRGEPLGLETLAALGVPMGFVGSAFGCPFDCTFCCIGGFTGGRYLNHEIAAVIRDIRLLGEVPVIRLVDANTFGNPDHARRLCRAIVAAGINKTFLADIRSDTVVRHPDLLREWKAAGLRSVIIGFEAIDDQALDGMNKAGTAALNPEAMAILNDLGINIVGDFIVSPEYTDKDFARLADFHGVDPFSRYGVTP